MPTLQASSEAYAVQAELAAAAVLAATRAQARGVDAVARAIAAYQILAAQQGAAAVGTQVAEQGISAPVVAGVAATAFAGLTSAGAPMQAVLPSVENLSRFVATMIQDAGRGGASLGVVTRPNVDGYTRMIGSDNPCSRCIILAGKFYRWNEGFERHPLCKCVHIPTNEDVAGDTSTNPAAFFRSLSRADQDKTFGVAGAQAIRDGADMAQVVNARRDVFLAQDFGQTFLATRAGVTRFGGFGKANAERAAAGKAKLPYRLMPESIYLLARDDRDEALRLLKLYGFLL